MASNINPGDPLSPFFLTFFSFCYFLCISPFRIVRLPQKVKPSHLNQIQTQTLITKSFLLQKLICGVFVYLTFFGFLAKVRLKIPSDTKVPSQYFHLVLDAARIIFETLMVISFWSKNGQETFLQIVNLLRSSKFRTLIETFDMTRTLNENLLLTILLKKWTRHSLFILTGTGVVVSLLQNAKLHTDLSYWGQLRQFACYAYFLSDKKTGCDESGWKSSLASVLAFPGMLTVYYQTVLKWAARLLLVICSFTLWAATKLFVIWIKTGNRLKPSQNSNERRHVVIEIEHGPQPTYFNGTTIYEQVKCLEELAQLLTSVIGRIVSWFIVSVVFHYAVHLNKMFEEFIGPSKGSVVEVTLTSLLILLFLWRTMSVFFFCADSCYQVKIIPD